MYMFSYLVEPEDFQGSVQLVQNLVSSSHICYFTWPSQISY